MPGRFEGKVVIISGSSNGIGRETAKLFAAEGAKVTITGRSEKALEETFNLMVSAGASPASIHKVIGNLTEESLQMKLIEETISKFGKLDILVNNAGAVAQDKTGTSGFDQPFNVFDYVINLNLRAWILPSTDVFRVLTLTQLAMPHLIKSQGEVVNVSSIVAMPFSSPAYPFYSVSKAGLDQLTRNLAHTYILKGVRVNSVNPGWVTTELIRKLGVTEELENQVLRFAHSSIDPTNSDDRNYGPQHFCDSDWPSWKAYDIAKMIAFLSDRSQSEYVVGQCMVVDGGATLLNPLFNGHQH